MTDTFTCDACGLKHTHPPSTHSIEKHFDLPDSYVDQMDLNPDCNCGVHELYRDYQNDVVSLTDEEVERLEQSVDGFAIPQSVREYIYEGGDETNLSGF